MKKLRLLFFLMCLFMALSYNVKAEDKCSNEKIAELKKHVESVSAVSEFYENGVNMGKFDSNLVTVYGIPEGFYATNKSSSVIFNYNEEGSETKIVDYSFGDLNVYSDSCNNTILKTIKLDLKELNAYYDYEECRGIQDKVDVCSRFYNTDDISYSVFVRKVNDYKNGNVTVKEEKFDINTFIKDNLFIIIGIGVVILAIVIFLIANNIKKNKLD